MKPFSEIAKSVFNKSPISLQGIEEITATSLKAISSRFENKEITKEQATTEKELLKKKYESVCKFHELVSEIEQFLLRGWVETEPDTEFIDGMVREYEGLFNKCEGTGIPVCDKVAIAAMECFMEMAKE